MEDTLSYSKAFYEVMMDEFGFSNEQAEHILSLVNKKMMEYNKLENKLLRNIEKCLKDGFVFDAFGGFGNSEISLYFKDHKDKKGYVPTRFFKNGNLSDKVMTSLMCNWGILLVEKCLKCNRLAVNIEIEELLEDKNSKNVYDLVYCESCKRVFIKNNRMV